MSAVFPCPCCGYQVFDEPPGSYDICGICFWEDDAIQLRWPDYRAGANRLSLIQAQAEYAKFGAMEHRFIGLVRQPDDGDLLDPGWRPVDPTADAFEACGHQRRSWPEDRTVLYWWRPTFWRRDFLVPVTGSDSDTTMA